MLSLFAPFFMNAQEHTNAHESDKGFDIKAEIFGHIRDAHDWHIFSYTNAQGEEKHVSIPLPVVLYRPNDGLQMFMSSAFEHGHAEPNGFKLNHETGVVESVDGAKVIDFSITKNVLSMFIVTLLLILLFTSIAKKYKKGIGLTSAPKGMQNAIEAIIGFIGDSVAIPSLGKKHYMKFFPLLLSFFFFIWLSNLFGLIPFPPGASNVMGNIAVTLALALVFFIVMLFSSRKGFWMHMLNPPGVPVGIKFILVPIEIISNLLIKPVALAIRLFANIFAGHTIIISIILLVFIFGSLSKVAGWSFLPVSLAFSIFMFFLELLVAAIQAFIFTNLAAVFIGQAIEDHDHH